MGGTTFNLEGQGRGGLQETAFGKAAGKELRTRTSKQVFLVTLEDGSWASQFFMPCAKACWPNPNTSLKALELINIIYIDTLRKVWKHIAYQKLRFSIIDPIRSAPSVQ